MCGRFIIDNDDNIADMRLIFEKLKKFYSDTVEFQNVKKGEIFPSDTVPIIIPEKETKMDVVPMQWGIRGYYGNLLINARCEGVFQKKIFKDSIVNKRCVIPANGFFEWAKLETGKEKYMIRPAYSNMLYFAGIYEKLPDPVIKGKEQVRFVIITREARGLIRSIHHRMPVVVERKDILKWMNGTKSNIYEIFNEPTVPEYTFTNLGGAG